MGYVPRNRAPGCGRIWRIDRLMLWTVPQQYFTGINNLDEGELSLCKAAIRGDCARLTCGLSHSFRQGFIFTDPNLLTSATTQQATLQNQFDLTLKGLFPLLTQSQRQQVAQQYPIADAPITGNTFQRISTIIADSTFVYV